ARVLLRQPVEPGVRLVPDDVVVDAPGRDRARDGARPGAEGRRWMVGRLLREEREDDVDAGLLRERSRALHEGKVVDRGRVARVPRQRPAVLGEVRAGELLVEPGAAVVGVLREVV